MVVDTTSEKVKKAQDGVLEFLLANHPLDCPVCDKGGECPLQDQTLAYGPGESRFVEEKRHFEKPIAISDLVLLDRERCIQCARCTRFAAEVAGEAQIDFAGRGEAVEVATFPTEPFSSYFSGNTVQICPVGALDRDALPLHRPPLGPRSGRVHLHRLLGRLPGGRAVVAEPPDPAARHRLRAGQPRLAVRQGPLRLRVGQRRRGGHRPACPSELADEAVDVAPATASQVVSLGVSRGQFLGEARETGRFEHGRLVEPRVRKEGELVPVSWGEALAAAAAGLGRGQGRRRRRARWPLIGGARLTNESAYAWAKLAKGVIGTDSVDAQLGDGLPADLVLGLPRATIDEACAAPVLVTLAGDLREELPVLFLRLREARGRRRHAADRDRPDPDRADAAGRRHPAHPARRRAADGPGPDRRRRRRRPRWARTPRAARCADGRARGGPRPAGRPPRRRGRRDRGRPARPTPSRARWRPRRVRALADGAAQGHVPARAAPGQRLRGARHGPGPGPPARAGSASTRAASASPRPGARCRRPPGSSTADILASMAGEARRRATDERRPRCARWSCSGADPLERLPRPRRGGEGAVGRALRRRRDRPPVRVGRRPRRRRAALRGRRTSAPGTTTNIEGRVSRLGPKLTAPGFAWPDWMIAAELAAALGADLGVASDNDLSDELTRTAPAYAGLTQRGAALRRGARRDPGAAHRRATTTATTSSPIDPIALPGVESVERQGAPPRVGTGGSRPAPRRAPPHLGSPPPLLSGTGTGGAEPLQIPKADNYSLRLVSGRRLYDAGSSVTGSPSLTPLVPHAGGAGQPLRPRPPRRQDGRPRQGALGPGRADPGRRVRRGRAPGRRRHRLQRARRRERAGQRGGHAHRQPPAR